MNGLLLMWVPRARLTAASLAFRSTVLCVLVLSFPLAYYAAGGSTHLVFFRYMLPAVPFLCLSAAYLVARLPGAAAAAVAVAMMLPGIFDAIQLDRRLGRTDTRVLAADWIRDHVPAGASLYQSGAIYGHLWLDSSKGYREFGLAPPNGPFTQGGKPALQYRGIFERSPLLRNLQREIRIEPQKLCCLRSGFLLSA